jgi:hypothetical protein
MGCCGKAREAARGEYASVTPQTATAQPAEQSVTIRYLGRSAIRIRGPRTGHVYVFRPGEPDQLISHRDAEVLLRTGLFRVA